MIVMMMMLMMMVMRIVVMMMMEVMMTAATSKPLETSKRIKSSELKVNDNIHFHHFNQKMEIKVIT